MLDFVKSLNLSDELKTNEIYNIFKTGSSDLDFELLSILQQFHTTNEFLNFYTKGNFENSFKLYDILISSTIFEETEKNSFNLQMNEYASDISKIIFLFSLIHKNNELLNNLLINTQKVLKKFYKENKKNSFLKEKINNCINDLINDSQVTAQRNYSRRSTKENTISTPNIFIGHNSGKSKQAENNSNEEYLFFQCSTPKFEEDEQEIAEVNEEQSYQNNLDAEKKGDYSNGKVTIDSNKESESSLTLKHMKFCYDSDEENTRHKKKNNTFKLALSFKKQNFSKKKNISNKFNCKILTGDLYLEKENNQNIIVNCLKNINILFKNKKINTQEKTSMKKLLISYPESIIKMFNEYNLSNKCQKHSNQSICKFLLDQIKKSKK